MADNGARETTIVFIFFSNTLGWKGSLLVTAVLLVVLGVIGID